ncbi:MAG: TatD family deoxyribonuclease [Chlorobium sp.]|nr:MAG: TatD family deoxyribonuclease [Chlorobium sp.]
MFVDTHCHLSFPEFDQDRHEVIERLKEAQVSVLIDPGVDVATSRKSIELASQVDFIYANVGLHPHEATQPVDECVFAELARLADSPKVVAIGEIGLDYHYPDYNRSAQHHAFREMLRLAQSLDMPVVIHCRDAWEDMLHILAEESHSGMRGVMHCFSGDVEIANACIRMGFKLSIPGTVTYKRSLLPDVIRSVALDDLLTETDAPYLAPVPWRGKRNEPAWVRLVTESIAHIREISLEEAAEAIARNTTELFRLPAS